MREIPSACWPTVDAVRQLPRRWTPQSRSARYQPRSHQRRRAVRTAQRSVGESVPQARRDVEVVTDSRPHQLRVLPGGQRLIHGSALQRGKDVIVGDGGRSQRPELSLHEGSQLGQTHGNDPTDARRGTVPALPRQSLPHRPCPRPETADCSNGPHRHVEPGRATGDRRRTAHHHRRSDHRAAPAALDRPAPPAGPARCSASQRARQSAPGVVPAPWELLPNRDGRKYETRPSRIGIGRRTILLSGSDVIMSSVPSTPVDRPFESRHQP